MAEQKFLGEAGLDVVVQKVKGNESRIDGLKADVADLTTEVRTNPFQLWYNHLVTYAPIAKDTAGTRQGNLVFAGYEAMSDFENLTQNMAAKFSGVNTYSLESAGKDTVVPKINEFFAQTVNYTGRQITIKSLLSAISEATLARLCSSAPTTSFTAAEVTTKLQA